jgi:hypothetical protein
MLDQQDPYRHVASNPVTAHAALVVDDTFSRVLHPGSTTYSIPYLLALPDPPTSNLSGVSSL